MAYEVPHDVRKSCEALPLMMRMLAVINECFFLYQKRILPLCNEHKASRTLLIDVDMDRSVVQRLGMEPCQSLEQIRQGPSAEAVAEKFVELQAHQLNDMGIS